MQSYRGQSDESRSPHMSGYYLQPITFFIAFWRPFRCSHKSEMLFCYPYIVDELRSNDNTHADVCKWETVKMSEERKKKTQLRRLGIFVFMLIVLNGLSRAIRDG